MYYYFNTIFEPMLYDDFNFTIEWFQKADYKNIELMKHWTLPENLIHFNKIIFCLFNIFVKLNITSNFQKIMNEIII